MNASPFKLPLLITALAFTSAFGSDHADPMNVLNPFEPQSDPVANITDLHAFVVDKDRKPIHDAARLSEADQLVISLCVRRRLLPFQIERIAKDVPKYSFRVHLDLNPTMRFFDPTKTRDGRDYEAALAEANKPIPAATAARDAAHKESPPMGKVISEAEQTAQAALDKLLAARGALVAQHQADAAQQGLYGGIIDDPTQIGEEALLEFKLNYTVDGENSEASLQEPHIEGIPNDNVNRVVEGRRSLDGTHDVVKASPWKDGAINIQTGIFDDPFIFPRFFRGNIVGIVTSIPLKLIRRPNGHPITDGPILLWATTHTEDGTQSDHVGRSLRTQLPRFGYLNGIHPSQQVARIQKRHESPTLLDATLVQFIAPLEAHRHYDMAPDVMIYDLTKPAKFPNGRWLEDDVAQILADNGEPLLVDLANAESRQFPRSTVNDKPFRTDFPYLAPRWTARETADQAMPGGSFGNFIVPNAPDAGAIALPDFPVAVWKSLYAGLLIGLLAVLAFALYLWRGVLGKVVIAILGIAALCMIQVIISPKLMPMDKGFMEQPQHKFIATLLGTVAIAGFGVVAVHGWGVRRGLKIAAAENDRPTGSQSPVQADRQYNGSSFNDVRNAVFTEPYYGPVWGEKNGKALPIYTTTFDLLAQGIFSFTKRFLFKDAADRTLVSRADLRWGDDGKGVRRLLHPNGVCLTGEWEIDKPNDYTGYFAPGSKGLVIGRYSSGIDALRGQKRTLSLVGKLFPTLDPNELVYLVKDKEGKQGKQDKIAAFITQNDLGAAYPDRIHDAPCFNAPNVTVLKRGFDIPTLLLIALTFARADKRNNIRQLYEIAELGKPEGMKTKCPPFMRLRVVSDKIGGGDDTADFRDEVLGQIYDRSNPVPQRPLVFEIAVADKGDLKGLINKRLVVKEEDWNPIGRITFKEAVASHNGDFVIHFHHPKWRNDVNDPNSLSGPTGLGKFINAISDKLRSWFDRS